MRARKSTAVGSNAPKSYVAKQRRWRAAGAAVIAAAFGGGMVDLASGCQQSPTVVPVRSMTASGKVSFVCLHPEEGEKPLAECTAQLFTSICQYEYQDDAGNADAQVTYDDAGTPLATLFPHLYGLVTQQTTGEVAVVDTSALSNGVLDENPLEPGANFLRIGDGPTGIASTPGSVATFVGTSETGRQAIYAIPSSRIRPAASWGVPDNCIGPGDASVTPPELTSWAACYLGKTPGDIILVDDPYIGDPSAPLRRPTCDGDYEAALPTDTISQKEKFHGRSKLVVAFPDEGGIGVFDAQNILNNYAPDGIPHLGDFPACELERWIQLKADVSGLGGQQPLPTGLGQGSCTNAVPATPTLKPSYTPKPAGMSYSNGKLFIADAAAPVIHVVSLRGYVETLGEVATPCNPIEEAPLLPTSLDDPTRVVFTSKVSASPAPTPDGKSYLYATDVEDASVMVFDITDKATSRRPLQRTTHPEWNPFQPRDRVRFGAPAADIIIVQRDIPAIDPITGVAAGGKSCDPDPNAITCVATAHNCDIGTSYRTSIDYTTGAGPQKLRGEFAFAALTNGKLAVIDIQDFDAPCRGPGVDTQLAGCGTSNASGLVTSLETSCNVVAFGEPRAADYIAVGTDPGNHVPGIATYPLLYAADGSVVADTDTTTAPHMVATLPATIPASCTQPCDPLGCGITCDRLPGCPLEIFVGGTQTPLDVQANVCSTACQPYGAPCVDTVASADCCVGVGGATCDASLKICVPKTCTPTGVACDPTTAGAQACTAANCERTPGTAPKCKTTGAVCTDDSAGCSAQNCPWASQSAQAGFIPGGVPTNDNTLIMNMEDPRVHVADQNWTVAYEGAIPGFDQKFATLTLTTPSASSPWSAVLTTTDASGQFCDNGVLGQLAFAQMLAVQPKPTLGLSASDLADYVQVISDIPDPTDTYWTDMGGAGTTCDYPTCFGIFGSTDSYTLSTTRDLLIYEAFEDHLQLIPRGGEDLTTLLCCFPQALQFNVRVGHQWAVSASETGFIHHVVTDPSSGVCRNSCDPTQERKNSRLVETAPTLVAQRILDRPSGEIDPSPSFQNPMFRFAITTGKVKCTTDAECSPTAGCTEGVCAFKKPSVPATSCTIDSDCPTIDSATSLPIRCDPGKEKCKSSADCVSGTCTIAAGAKEGACTSACFQPAALETTPTPRDSVYRFATNGSFVPLSIGLAIDSTSLIEPLSVSYLAPTAEVAVTDGSLSGLILVSLQTATISRSFF